MAQQRPRDILHFSPTQSLHIDPYLPPRASKSPSAPSTTPSASPKPFVTLTFATSLDSQLSLAPGIQTALSGPESKAMTHYLRSKHNAILIGVGTAIADDPSLNCRIEGVGGYSGEGLEGQPRPIVVDPNGRWELSVGSKVIGLAKELKGRAPWIVTRTGMDEGRRRVLESVGGKVLRLPFENAEASMSWSQILDIIGKEGVRSVMIEGGGAVINDLLSPRNFHLVDSVIVTIAPTWLGKGGVQVCPDARVENGAKLPVGSLDNVKWVPLGDDVVLCGRPGIGQAGTT